MSDSTIHRYFYIFFKNVKGLHEIVHLSNCVFGGEKRRHQWTTATERDGTVRVGIGFGLHYDISCTLMVFTFRFHYTPSTVTEALPDEATACFLLSRWAYSKQ